MIKSIELKSSREGVRNGIWPNPEQMCATIGTATEIRIAIADFKTILTELSKLK